MLLAPVAGRRSGDPGLGTVLLSQGIVQSEGLTYCIHAELPPVLGLVCGGIQHAEVELGEEPHVLAGEDADMSLPISPVVPCGHHTRCGHTPEEWRAGSDVASHACLGPSLSRGDVGHSTETSVSPSPFLCHHPLQGAIPMGLRDSKGPSPAPGCAVAAVWLLWALHLPLQLGATGMAQIAVTPRPCCCLCSKEEAGLCPHHLLPAVPVVEVAHPSCCLLLLIPEAGEVLEGAGETEDVLRHTC